ncbi:MAG TPA: response regulator transcription factor [Verrucomicrobiae bacterium]|nr:response regulator transcription factor [Verrucomicrobiae bacterium]
MRILIVEDHPDAAANLGDYLSSCGHQVDFAGDGLAGLAQASAGAFDAIVLDRMLPGLDGATLCRRLRTDAQVATPVLMLTAMDAVDDRVAGFDAGADDYVVKPYALVEVKARLEALARRAQGAVTEAVLRVGDLSYDARARRAGRRDRVLALGPTARKLLEHLMRQSHRVVPREELEYALWGDQPPDADALRVHVHALRREIGEPPLLHTVRGVGYRLAAEVA